MDGHEDPAPRGANPGCPIRSATFRPLHSSIRTERAYVDWIRWFVLFHGKRYSAENGGTRGGGVGCRAGRVDVVPPR